MFCGVLLQEKRIQDDGPKCPCSSSCCFILCSAGIAGLEGSTVAVLQLISAAFEHSVLRV